MSRTLEERVKRFQRLYPHEIGYALVRDLWDEIDRLKQCESKVEELNKILDCEYGEG